MTMISSPIPAWCVQEACLCLFISPIRITSRIIYFAATGYATARASWSRPSIHSVENRASSPCYPVQGCEATRRIIQYVCFPFSCLMRRAIAHLDCVAVLDLFECPEDDIAFIVMEQWCPQLFSDSSPCCLHSFLGAVKQFVEVNLPRSAMLCLEILTTFQ